MAIETISVASPEENLRFMDATAEYMTAEHLRHDQERFSRVLNMHRQAGTLGDREPASLEELGYGFSWHNIMPPEVIAEIIAAGRLEPSEDERRAFEGNVLVENGHAWYGVVNDSVFRLQPDFRRWGNTWLAEEQPHGPSAETWGWISGYTNSDRVFAGTQGYIRNGLTLRFVSAADALAYPALQEPATQLTHKEVMTQLPKSDESLAGKIGRRIMANIISDERGHAIVYTNMVRHGLETGDPEIVSQQMCALARAALGFTMPGMESDIPGREEITRAYRTTGVFTPEKLARTVLIPALAPEIDRYGWKISEKTDLTDEGKAAQAQLIQFADDLQVAVDSDNSRRKVFLVIGKARKAVGQIG